MSLNTYKTVNQTKMPNGIKDRSMPNGCGDREKNEGLKIRGFRHVVACLALSSIIIANTNRQAYNNSLARMERKRTIPQSGNNHSTDDQVLTTTMSQDISDPDQVTITAEESVTNPMPYGLSTEDCSPTTTAPSSITSPTTEEVADNDSFDWTPSQVAALQSAFNYGYMPFMIPGGRLSELYGAKWVVFLSGFGSAICSLAVPFLADTSFELLFVSRIVMGELQTLILRG